MRMKSLSIGAFSFLVLFSVSVFSNTACGVDYLAGANSGLDYYLTFTSGRPSVGSPVTMTLAARPGMPPPGQIRWSLSGASASNGNVVPGNPLMYSFIPNTPGSFFVNTEFYDQQGVINTVTMELIIGSGLPDMVAFPVPPGYSVGQPLSSSQMFIAVNPNQPRVGQPVAFTLHYGNVIQPGSQVRWEFSGGPIASPGVSGVNNEVFTLTPTAQTSYYVRAMLIDQRGNLTAEVNVGFLTVP